MTALRKLTPTTSLTDIEELLNGEADLSCRDRSLDICISDNYYYSTTEALPNVTRINLASVIERSRAEGFLIPREDSSFSLVPISGALCKVIEQASSRIALADASLLVPMSEIERLIALGILGLRLARGVVSGPAARVLLASKESGIVPQAITTDPLSMAALRHACRIPIKDPFALTARLYCYNSELIFRSRMLQDTTQQVQRIAESNFHGVFKPRVAPPENPGWYLFESIRRHDNAGRTPVNAKLYVSPVVADLVRCLSRLVEILPSLPCRAWKIGRYTYGIARPDKICVYFSSFEHAQSAAQIIAHEMSDIEAQGVPFTTRQDQHGLISIGVDPNKQAPQPRLAIQNSWRLWIARKLASAMAAAKLHPHYPLSPEQASLWGVYYFGVNPESWTVRDVNFWRN